MTNAPLKFIQIIIMAGRVKILIVFSLFVIVLNAPAQLPDAAKMIGIWQDSPVLGSGWSDNYQFFMEGSFNYNYNEMVCDKRLISLSGTWTIKNSDQLQLTIKQKTVLKGGKLVRSTGSCSSEFEIQGGVIKTIDLKTPETKKLILTDYRTDDDHFNIETMKIEKFRFWKMSMDPRKNE
jgi:hypothetical protein